MRAARPRFGAGITGVSEISILQADCREALRDLADQSVHLIVTDPPYFIDRMGADWDHDRLSASAARAGVVGKMPVGMKFDPAQGRALQEFMAPVAGEMLRVLKPGGFCIVFSQGRLIHRMACALEDAGFEIRDMLGWSRRGQPKAQKQEHHVRRQMRAGRISAEEGARIIASMGGRKTAQLGPQLEPMVLAMKPVEGTFVGNWMAHETGLMDTSVSLDGRFPSNLMAVERDPRQPENPHFTPKPVALIAHLIALFSKPGQVVLDPFLGSGSHGVAAAQSGRDFIGIELDPHYAALARARVAKARPQITEDPHDR